MSETAARTTPAHPQSAVPEPPRADRLERLKPSEIREIHNVSERVRRERPDLDMIPLHFGESDQGTPAFIVEAGVRALREGAVFYENNSGRPDLKEALSEHWRGRIGEGLSPEHFVITSGGVQAIHLGLLGIVAPGDDVINVTPAWPNFRGAAELAGAHVHDLPLAFDAAERRFHFDFDALERLAAAAPRLRAVVVNSPSNPTGWIMAPEAKQRLTAFCRERGLYLMADEMYDRIVFETGPCPSFWELREPGDRLVLINGFSKTYCMTGWRLGYLVCDPPLAARLAQMQEYVTSCAPAMAQVAALTALREGEAFIAESLARYRRLRDLIVKRLGAIPGMAFAEPAGSFYAFFRHPASVDSVRFCEALLHATGVITAPGRAFGEGGEGWVRVCFAQEPERLEEALRRLAGHLGHPA